MCGYGRMTCGPRHARRSEAMDIPVHGAYPQFMSSRLATLLAMLVLTVMTMVTSSHMEGLKAGVTHAAHMGETLHISADNPHSCGDEQHCVSDDGSACEVLCGGLAALLIAPVAELARDQAPAQLDRADTAIVASRTPGLHERPPQSFLL